MLWEAVRKESISHWLMLWSSSRIREVRKEIGSTQSRLSKKLRELTYTGYIRLGESIAVHVSQLHFLVDYLPLGERRRGFTLFDNTSGVVLVFASLFPLSLPFIFCCECDFNWFRLFINFVLSFCSCSAH